MMKTFMKIQRIMKTNKIISKIVCKLQLKKNLNVALKENWRPKQSKMVATITQWKFSAVKDLRKLQK